MVTTARVRELQRQGRRVEIAERGDSDLGPLRNLPGKWISEGRGWNMIALPFISETSAIDYRLLLNQYDEELNFTLVDKAVPNRGVNDDRDVQTDQFVVTLDYEQVVHQIAVTDRPESLVTGAPGAAIHHEPGLFLHMLPMPAHEHEFDQFDVGRLATVPHGDTALALGISAVVEGAAPIPAVNGLPIGVNQDLASPYLEPYNHFHVNPFKGTVTNPQFEGFDPVAPHRLLLPDPDNPPQVTQTTVLSLDTTFATGGIHNIPFIVKQANAVSMKSTFWVHELADGTLQLQYLQIVILDFFPRRDGLPGRIGWPHVSINTLTPAPEGYEGLLSTT